MREIKFRCWNTINKKWHMPTEWGEEPADAYIGYGVIPEIGFRSNKDYIWLQYTGLKDEDGEEMFENDIVFDEDGEYSKTVIIEWDNEDARFFGKDIYTGDSFSMQEIDGKIIGNIYENPDLLDNANPQA
jgi:uncharacterized phage protein (TIGR01671 family)